MAEENDKAVDKVDTVLTDDDVQKQADTLFDADKKDGADKDDSKADASDKDKDDSKDDADKSKDKDSDADKSKDEGKSDDEYGDFKLPEGVELDKEAVTEFKTLAKELELPKESAQKLVDLQAKLMTKAGENMTEAWAKIQTEWRDKAQADKEYGGKNFKDNVGLAQKAIKAFGSKEFSEALESTGMGNHPELIRFLVKVGKEIGEDGVMNNGNKAGGEKKDAASILYPDMA
jgi:hypothetical protein